MKKLYLPLAILLLTVIFLFSGCSSTATTAPTQTSKAPPTTSPVGVTTTAAATTVAPTKGGTLRLSMGADATSLGYPPTMQGTPDQLSARPAVESLFRQDDKGNIVPWLVESYTQDAAAKTYTFKLRKGIKFHDGSDFNAAVVQWNIMNFKSTPAGSGTYGKLSSVDIVDDSTVRLNLSVWDNTMLSNMSSAPPGYIISKAAFDAHGGANGGADWCRNNPVGTGPFTFVSWTRDVQKVWVKNNNYWIPGQPYLDRIEINVIADPTVQAASILKGDIDVMCSASITNADSLSKQGYVVYKCPVGGGLRTMVGDSGHADSPFSKLQVRQAMTHAVNAQPIIDSVWKGYVPASNQFAMPGTWSYNTNLVGYPYNPAKAKQLLADAGYPSGFKTTMYVLNDQNQINTYTAIQAQLLAVGIDAQLQVLDSGKYVDMQQNSGWSNAIYCLGILVPADPLGMMTSFLSTITGPYKTTWLHNDTIDKAINDAFAAPDFATKQKLTWETQKVINETYCMWTPVLVNIDLSVKTKKVHGDGIDTTPFGLWTPESAYLDK
jgi:peptide/nickel transport system substrate-binding protein